MSEPLAIGAALVGLALVVFFALGAAPRSALSALALMSLALYAWLDPRALPLLLGSMAVNYALGRLVANDSARPGRILAFGVAANLTVLAIFKAASTAALPLGISFFTFQQIAYLVDTYRGDPAVRRPVDYVLLVAFFPKVIAGPFVRHVEFLDGLARPRFRPRAEDLTAGLTLITIGFVKKVVIAANLSPHAASVFDSVARGAGATFADAWAGAVAYALELYFDFSAYSDMAIGCARLFGVHLPINFNSPYRATSVVDFWKRWHMTLSQLLFDLVYFPLVASARRGDVVRPYAALGATMLACGLWHGTGWTFVVWGVLHGFYLSVNHAWRAWRKRRSSPVAPSSLWRSAASGLLVFVVVVVAWVPFRAADLGVAGHLLASMGGLHDVTFTTRLFGGAASVAHGLGWVAAGLAIVWLLPNSQEWTRMIVAGTFPAAPTPLDANAAAGSTT
jgi:D-alanyl-lipoteichoic acid acyltransferase DltB (MBOAT superfamily)